MDHLKPFTARETLRLAPMHKHRWRLKRYAILAVGRAFDEEVAAAATAEALNRLPDAGSLETATGNHGVGFQIIHFAETAIVSPTFYWQWGSVLARLCQIKAHWDTPTLFGDGTEEVVGCIWEMNVVHHETRAWTSTILGLPSDPAEKLAKYVNTDVALV